MNSKSGKISIYRNNLVVGKLRILNLRKDNNNTFFSYVYGDFCLKYILALDISSDSSSQSAENKKSSNGKVENLFLQALHNQKKKRNSIHSKAHPSP